VRRRCCSSACDADGCALSCGADASPSLSRSGGNYHHLTLLQGNIGSAIELGTYGIGIRGNVVADARVDSLSIHRITQDPGGQDDQLGSVLGSRTCPWGITLKNISVSNVHVHKLGDGKSGGNRFSTLWAVGTLGAPFGPHYSPKLKKLSTLDRWFFCSNEVAAAAACDADVCAPSCGADSTSLPQWWRGCTHGGAAPDCNVVKQSGAAARFESLSFSNWSGLGAADGSSPSILYNFAENASTTFTNLSFNNVSVASLDGLLGEKVLAGPGNK